MDKLFSRKVTTAAFLLYVLILPLSFLIQSLLQSKLVILPISLLFIYFIASSMKHKNFHIFGHEIVFEKILTALFILNIFFGFVFTLALQGEYPVVLRNVVVYILPTFLLFSFGSDELRADLIDKTFKILIVVGVIFAVFQIYSYSSPAPTYFEKAIYDYIHLEYGTEKGEFLGSYRRQGPTDHIHVTSLFLAIAAACAFLRLLVKNTTANAVVFYTILLGFLATGVRLSIISAYICFAVVIHYFRKYKYALHLFVGTALCLVYLGFMALNPEHFKMIYIYPILHLDFTPNASLNEVVIKPAYSQLMAANDSSQVFEILFGHGFSSQQALKLGLLNDDLFLVQIFTNFGILGLSAFFGLVFYLMWNLFRHPVAAKKLQALTVLLVLFVMIFTTIHSGVIFRRIVFPFFILFLAFARYLFVRAPGKTLSNE